MKREKVIVASEFLASAAVIAAGFAVGGPIGASVVTAIGIELGGSIIEGHYRGIRESLLSHRDGILNHDIQHALLRAYVKALTGIEKKYFDLAYANALSAQKQKSIRNLFTYLKERAQGSFTSSVEAVARAGDVRDYLYLEPAQAEAKLWQNVDAATVIYSNGEHFGEFFKQNLLGEIQYWFGEELKTDNKECNKAWRAFQRMLLEGIKADVSNVREAHESVRRDLLKLDILRERLEEISDVINHRLPDEPFQESLERAVTSMQTTLSGIAGATSRTENKVDTIAADLKALASQLFPEDDLRRTEQIAGGPEKVFVWHMPDTGSVLFGRDDRLRQLDAAWHDQSTNVLSLVAPGGVGKSTLINYWLSKLAKEKYRGASKVFAWSFYRQGVTDLIVSADLFIEYALKWFDDPDPTQGTLWEKGERLARLVKKNRTLLIIDGLEPLQYPPGPRGGKLKDVAVTALIRDLAAFNPGLCVISTRLAVTDLEQFEASTAPKVDLEILSPEAGAQLLAHQGVRGDDDEFRKASQEFGGHALALTLLGSFLHVVYEGDIHQRDKVNLLSEDDEQGGHAQRVMASYEQWLGEGAELALLRLMGLFDRPVDEKVVHYLRAGEAIQGLTTLLMNLSEERWRRVVEKLRSARLLAERNSEQPNVLDTHPLVREYFGRRLIQADPGAWREGNDRLYEYYKRAAPSLPTNIREMDTLFLAAIHGCEAGRYQDVLEQVYIPRVMRGDEAYAANRLGAVGALLSVLAHFFENGDWGRPVPALDPTYQLFILTEAGRYLTEANGYAAHEVGQCYETAKILCEEAEDKYALFEVMLGMCRFHRLREELDRSGELAKDLLALCQELEDETLLPAAHRALATNYFYLGDFVKAKEHADRGAVIYPDARQALINAQLDVNEPAISCLGYSALSQWFLGRPDQARVECDEALSRAKALAHAHTLAITLLIDAMVNHFRRDAPATYASAQDLIDVCAEQGFLLWGISGEILKFWATTQLDKAEREIPGRIRQSIAAWLNTEAWLFTPYWYAILTDACLADGDIEGGLDAVQRGLRRCAESGERWWEAELHRLQGELKRAPAHPPSAPEEHFSKALEIARAQRARPLELRAAMSMATLWKEQGKAGMARALLLNAYDQFGEGFDTADLQEAKALLAELMTGGV